MSVRPVPAVLGWSCSRRPNSHPAYSEEASTKRQSLMRLDQVKHCTGEADQRERPDAAGDCGVFAFVNFLEREPEKKDQSEQQCQPLGEFDRGHGFFYMPFPARGNLRFYAETTSTVFTELVRPPASRSALGKLHRAELPRDGAHRQSLTRSVWPNPLR